MTVFVFYCIYDVMKAEKAFKDSGIPIDIIPVPRQVSSDCGMAVSLEEEYKIRAQDILVEHNIEIKGVYKRLSSNEWVIDT
ncbi:MAG: DUF3343 domain-containing protein [Deltaproteobacteria bacterium]|nr:DUF3343 domain-containing protein [Deltaproteobacteria bacterium]